MSFSFGKLRREQIAAFDTHLDIEKLLKKVKKKIQHEFLKLNVFLCYQEILLHVESFFANGINGEITHLYHKLHPLLEFNKKRE